MTHYRRSRCLSLSPNVGSDVDTTPQSAPRSRATNSTRTAGGATVASTATRVLLGTALGCQHACNVEVLSMADDAERKARIGAAKELVRLITERMATIDPAVRDMYGFPTRKLTSWSTVSPASWPASPSPKVWPTSSPASWPALRSTRASPAAPGARVRLFRVPYPYPNALEPFSANLSDLGGIDPRAVAHNRHSGASRPFPVSRAPPESARMRPDVGTFRPPGHRRRGQLLEVAPGRHAPEGDLRMISSTSAPGLESVCVLTGSIAGAGCTGRGN